MWVTVESGEVVGAPCARGKHSATLLGGFVYVLGGRGAGGCVPLRDFWRYCLASGRWERLECRGEAPPALQEHSATPHAGNLYVFGGEAGALSYETPLWIYDTQIQTWRKLSGQSSIPSKSRGTWSARGVRATGGAGGAAGPRGRRGHSAHALKDCLLVYGGYKDLRGSTNELWAFHYETETWHQVRTATAGPARHRHAAALHDNRLYVHGGQCDLRDCADLWHYDTMSRVWAAVRTPAKLSPSARSGHAGLRAGAHLYIFGGEARGHPTNELWRFHFATETWEQIMQSIKWPSPRVDSRALLVGGGEARACTGPPAPAPALAPAPRAAPAPAGFLREISKLSSFHIRRAARCSYSVLAGDQDSTESLVRADRASRTARTSRSSLCKSRSAYVIDERQPADGGECPDLSRDPVSVPDFDALSPRAHTRTALVYLDSDDEGVPESTSTKLTRDVATEDEAEAEAATSDYASADAVDAAAGFSNPHYLGPDVRALGGRGARGGRGEAAGDIELQELGGRRGAAAGRAARNGERQLHLLLVGGREPPHVALLQSPLSMWSYRLL